MCIQLNSIVCSVAQQWYLHSAFPLPIISPTSCHDLIILSTIKYKIQGSKFPSQGIFGTIGTYVSTVISSQRGERDTGYTSSKVGSFVCVFCFFVFVYVFLIVCLFVRLFFIYSILFYFTLLYVCYVSMCFSVDILFVCFFRITETE